MQPYAVTSRTLTKFTANAQHLSRCVCRSHWLMQPYVGSASSCCSPPLGAMIQRNARLASGSRAPLTAGQRHHVDRSMRGLCGCHSADLSSWCARSASCRPLVTLPINEIGLRPNLRKHPFRAPGNHDACSKARDPVPFPPADSSSVDCRTGADTPCHANHDVRSTAAN